MTEALPNHLYNRGLLSGRHSDITVNVFGTKYALHRLLLDRAPFFCSALSEPWFESSAKEITLHPEEVDANITQSAFVLALKRIYGCQSFEEEDREPIPLFATGCWLEMTDLIEASITAMLHQMTPAKLATYIKFVTSNYYGRYGDRILAAAKAMLCREGYEMLLRYYDGISGDIIREIVANDGFYTPGEWERWVLAKRILNRRLKLKAVEIGIISPDGRLIKPRPASLSFMAVRFDGVYRSTSTVASVGASNDVAEWLGLYTHPDIAPLLVLLDEGIHYVHMTFEQLQQIREQRDILGIPLMPEKVISNALWMSMELRQRVVNADEADMEVGLSQVIDFEEETPESLAQTTELSNSTIASSNMSSKAAGKKPVVETSDESDDDEDELDSGSWDGNAKPRKFWIPLSDATYSVGGSYESTATASRQNSRNRNASRIPSALEPQDLQWATDFPSSAQDRSNTPPTPPVATTPSPEIHYTHYPPFRFAVEFPPAKSLKPDKRVYSNTVWYAGSLWNVYVQKKESPKSTQLGIYLHRERQIDRSDEMISSYAQNCGLVEDRINHLERDFARRQGNRRGVVDARALINNDTASSSDTTLVARGVPHDLDTMSGLPHPLHSITKASEASLGLGSMKDRRFNTADAFDDEVGNDNDTNARLCKVPTLPRYLDARPTIKTYFKIYTPSKRGRMLSVYESAPDRFNFSQSWGWKSSSLVVDDAAGTIDEGGRVKDPRLRFMIVIGKLTFLLLWQANGSHVGNV